MKKLLSTTYYPFYLIILGLFIASCDSTDPLPISKAGFEVLNEDNLERSVPVKFVNLSTNAASFKWDFGDGNFDSLTIAPVHTYDEAGTYDVTLTATTEDGQTSIETQSIDIKTRVLAAFTIANIDFLNRVDPQDPNTWVPWDDDGTGPDLVFAFGPESGTFDDFIVTDTVKNLTNEDLPITWELGSAGYELTSELYDVILLDADPEKGDQEPYDLMFGLPINPVNYEFEIKENDEGLLQISIAGFAIDLYVSFTLQ